MSEEHDWPRDPTEEDIERLRPSPRELAQCCLPAILNYLGPHDAPPPRAAEVALVLVTTLADDPLLQEMGEVDVLSWEQALEIADQLLCFLEAALDKEGS